MLVTPPPSTTLVRPEQPKKALSLMLSIASGILMLSRPEQPEKAAEPMLVTPIPSMTLVRLEQPKKA